MERDRTNDRSEPSNVNVNVVGDWPVRADANASKCDSKCDSVLFADIDGVFNTFRSRQRDRRLGIDQRARECFDRILDQSPATIVIVISSWRRFTRLPEIVDILGTRHPERFRGVTPRSSVGRFDEISLWMNLHGYPRCYCIIDDENHHWTPDQRRHWIQTTDHYGLHQRLIPKALALLTHPIHPIRSSSPLR